jgi:endogenous inhibitor of DNA gyrase (YacG/DUF329 family)
MPKHVACPNCHRPVEWGPASPFKPFCSARCRLIDLGEWLAETRTIADPTDAPSDDPPPGDEPISTH